MRELRTYGGAPEAIDVIHDPALKAAQPIGPALLPHAAGDWWLPDGAHAAQHLRAAHVPDWFDAANARLPGLAVRAIEIRRTEEKGRPGPAPEDRAWAGLAAAVLKAGGTDFPHDPTAAVVWTQGEALIRWVPKSLPARPLLPEPSPNVHAAFAPFVSWLAGLERFTFWFSPAPKSAHTLARLRAVGYQGDLP